MNTKVIYTVGVLSCVVFNIQSSQYTLYEISPELYDRLSFNILFVFSITKELLAWFMLKQITRGLDCFYLFFKSVGGSL